MAEVTLRQAVKIISSSQPTLWRRVDEGELVPTRREGKKGRIFIDIDELRRFAKANGYKFNEGLAAELARD